MLQGEMPFGSWRESELDTFARIAKGQLNLPQTFSPEAVDLMSKVSFELLFSFLFAFTLPGWNLRIFLKALLIFINEFI